MEGYQTSYDGFFDSLGKIRSVNLLLLTLCREGVKFNTILAIALSITERRHSKTVMHQKYIPRPLGSIHLDRLWA